LIAPNANSTEEIADELVKAFNLVPNFDVSKVGPTKYLRNQVTELYMPQCDTKTVKINGVTVHYVPLDDICREVLATSTEWISQYEEVDDIKHQCNSDGWKEYHKVFSPLFDKGYVPLYPSLWLSSHTCHHMYKVVLRASILSLHLMLQLMSMKSSRKSLYHFCNDLSVVILRRTVHIAKQYRKLLDHFGRSKVITLETPLLQVSLVVVHDVQIGMV
jgi:hypothetical protein